MAPGALNRTKMIRLQWIASEMQRKEAMKKCGPERFEAPVNPPLLLLITVQLSFVLR